MQSDRNGAPEDASMEDTASSPESMGAADQPAGGEPTGEMDRLRADMTSLNERHLRLAAEYDNYRKRTERERREVGARSQAELAGVLLDALDDLERVAGVEAASTSLETVLEGVRLVERKIARALESAGLETVDAEGAVFDPATMEALMTVPAEDPAEDEHVADVFQKGYRFNGQLLRPARVRVKKYED